MRRPILITGHPRSGTGYMAGLFTSNGYEIGHERIGEYGTSNWQMLVKAYDYPFPGDPFVRQDVQFDFHFHAYREPLRAIESIAFTERRSEWFREMHAVMFGNDFEKAVMSLAGWGKLARSQCALPVVVERAAALFGFDEVDRQNERDHDHLTERELQMLVSNEIWTLYQKIKEHYEITNNALDDYCYRHVIESL